MNATRTALRPVTPVGVLAARLADLGDRFDASGVEPTLLEELRALTRLASGLEAYVADCTSPASPALRDLARRSDEADWSGRDPEAVFVEPEMLSGHVEGRLLQFLVRMTGAERVLEIGMFTGYAALAMAEVLPSDGRVVACELDPDVAALARELVDTSPAGRQIEIRIGPASRTLAELEERGDRFDLVFLDADKAGYRGYVEQLLGGSLLATGAVICVDNTLMQGEPWSGGVPGDNGRAIGDFNRWLAADERVEQVLLPLRDGVTLVRRV